MDYVQQFEAQEIARHCNIGQAIASGDSNLQQFYKDAAIMVTGGSGFLGKQLIEKLFRSCKIKKVFLLIRTNKKYSLQDRIKRIFDDPVFDQVRKTQPEFTEKVIPVVGDVTDIRLGISDQDWKTLTEEVTIIFHGAATINFTDPLKKATLTNLSGTREMLLLAKQCKNLKSFVHISTAYSHAIKKYSETYINEQFYESPMKPDDLMKLVLNTDEKELDERTPKIIDGWPNTYTYTKAVAEEAVRTMAGDLPVCIVRPAIVICSYREPAPGWIDVSCASGPTGFVLGSGLGVLRVLHANNDTRLDLVPVDIVNNTTLAAAQETVKRRECGQNDIKIYTVTGTRNPLLFGKMINILLTEGYDFPSPKTVWYPTCYVESNKFIFLILSYLMHFIPGYLVDGLLMLLGKKPMLTKIYNKAYKLNDVLGYYMRSTWKFGDTNTHELYDNLSPTDKIIFDCNTETLDWTKYILLWCVGCRRYIIKDGLEGTDYAIKKVFWLRILHYIILPLYLYVLYKIASVMFSIVFSVI